MRVWTWLFLVHPNTRSFYTILRCRGIPYIAYIGPRSRIERPRKTKIDTEVAHVTRDPDTTFKVKRSNVKVTRPLYSPRRLHMRQLQRWAWESIHRGNLLLRCRLLGAAKRFGAHRGRRGAGHIVAATCLQI